MHGNGNEDHPAFDRADDRPDRYFRDSDPSRKIFAWYMVSCSVLSAAQKEKPILYSSSLQFLARLLLLITCISVTWMHIYLYSKQGVVGYLMLRWYGGPP